MNFRIKSIILWPKDSGKEIRTIDFKLDQVNVITGGSEKGKSAIIAIVDYCLGSGICRIPTEKIREKTEWFGVLFSLDNKNEILLIRREPKDELASGEMFMKEDVKITVPEKVEANCNVEDVKNRLNSIARLSDLSFSDNDQKAGFDSRPSFRDLTSFLFQPQYIIANQSTLFYRADSMSHREKLKNIFPYIFNAVDNNYLELKDELREIEKKLNSLIRDRDRHQRYITKWIGQLRGYYIQSKEFGLLKNHPYPEENWSNEDFLGPLREIESTVNNNLVPTIEINSITNTNNRLAELTNQEVDSAHKLNALKHRQELIKRIIESNRIYRNNLLNQDNRLKLGSWFKTMLDKEDDKCPFCDTKTSKAKTYVNKLIETNTEIVEKGLTLNDNYSVLSGEHKKITKEIDELVVILNNIRTEIEALKMASNDDNQKLNTLNSIYLFAGKLEAEISRYDAINQNDELIDQIRALEDRKIKIESQINFEVIKTKIDRAKAKIIESIKVYANIFLAVHSDEVIEFNEKDLTLNFLIGQSGRKDSLYSGIGSGHNYMAYHISTLLALHEFFISSDFHPVPNFLILDQPTQVYFPETDVESIDKDDMVRVKRIFEVLHKAIERTSGKLQIIILEHVGNTSWEGFGNITGIRRWRTSETDSALIPDSWLE
jgi:hypothetical protein